MRSAEKATDEERDWRRQASPPDGRSRPGARRRGQARATEHLYEARPEHVRPPQDERGDEDREHVKAFQRLRESCCVPGVRRSTTSTRAAHGRARDLVPASAAVAPGAVTFPVDPAATVPQRQRRHARRRRRAARRVARPAFGTRGLARVRLPGAAAAWLTALQVLSDDAGRLLVVFSGPALTTYELPQLGVARCAPGGALDTALGDRGVAAIGIQSGCANCTPAALTPGGGVVLTGATGSVSAAIEHDPTAPRAFNWVVRRLTPAGAADPVFGTGGTATIASGDSAGHAISVWAANGEVAVAGMRGGYPALAWLSAAEGARVVAGRHRVRVTVRAAFRDLVGRRASTRAGGTLE